MGLVVSSLGAMLATLLAVWVGSFLGNRSQQQQWLRDRQADACAQVLREASNVVLALERLQVERRSPAAEGALVPHGIDFVAWNDALSMVGLVADHDVVEAAQAIDAEVWPAHFRGRKRRPSADDPIWELRRSHFSARLGAASTDVGGDPPAVL